MLGAAAAAPCQAREDVRFWHSMTGAQAQEIERVVARFNAAQREYRVVPSYRGPLEVAFARALAARRTAAAPHIVQVHEALTDDLIAEQLVVPLWRVLADAGQPFAVLRWLRQRGDTTRDWHGWCSWQGCRYRVRLVAAKLDPAAARQARRRQRRKAQKAGRRLTAPTRAVAGWILLITTLEAVTWSTADVLALYRARWQVELVFKRMKQLLRLNQIRSTNLTSVEATVRALLIAWALHEETVVTLRTLLPTGTPRAAMPVSSWLLTGLGLDTLRQQVQGTWSEARLRACLPRLRRFLASSPRRRRHQESAVRAWLDSRATIRSGRQQQVA